MTGDLPGEVVCRPIVYQQWATEIVVMCQVVSAVGYGNSVSAPQQAHRGFLTCGSNVMTRTITTAEWQRQLELLIQKQENHLLNLKPAQFMERLWA